MEITPEIKAQLNEQKKQCIFCKLISGEMEAKKVYEDDISIGLLDINPAMKGHTLYMTKEHYPIMPYIPADEFKHLFGNLAAMVKAVKEGMVSTGSNIFIANGGVAGQQAGHFLIHIIPREAGDGFFNFWFNKRQEVLEDEKVGMLGNNLPIMMSNHFKRNPAGWHKGAGEDFLVSGKVLYEDEKAICVLPEKGVVKGHLEIYSKEESSMLEKLSLESCAHLFYLASFAATAVFEGLGVHGTNIIMKSGNSDDNNGRLVIHVLPRVQGDSLSEGLLWKASPPSYSLDSVMSKLKDVMWKISYKEEKKENVSFDLGGNRVISNKKEEKPINEIEEAIRKAGGI